MLLRHRRSKWQIFFVSGAFGIWRRCAATWFNIAENPAGFSNNFAGVDNFAGRLCPLSTA